jgi:hypothetical protein
LLEDIACISGISCGLEFHFTTSSTSIPNNDDDHPQTLDAKYPSNPSRQQHFRFVLLSKPNILSTALQAQHAPLKTG